MQLRSVAVTLNGDEARFLQWTKSVGLARVEEYRDYVARCAAKRHPAQGAATYFPVRHAFDDYMRAAGNVAGAA